MLGLTLRKAFQAILDVAVPFIELGRTSPQEDPS